jgi:hypothetical protein
MATIIAGRFTQQDQVEQASAQLAQAGFQEDLLSSFFVTPPGQHDRYEMGGDHAISTGAEHSPHGIVVGAATGGTIGAVAGIAASPLLGPVGVAAGALVGAHVGSLVGSLSNMDEADQEPERVRHAGMMLAVATGNEDELRRAIELLLSCGAVDIERAEGSIVDGDWVDFDPLVAPALVEQPDAQLLPTASAPQNQAGHHQSP